MRFEGVESGNGMSGAKKPSAARPFVANIDVRCSTCIWDVSISIISRPSSAVRRVNSHKAWETCSSGPTIVRRHARAPQWHA